MLRILRFLWTGSWHEHKWKIIEKLRVFREGDVEQGIPIYFERVCQCEHCGTIKTFKT